MRTPVAIIEGYLGMLLNPATATVDSRGRTYATEAHTAAQHLGHLFQDLLDVTKIDDNRLRSYPILVDAGAAARQVVTQMQTQAKDKRLSLTYESAGQIQPLYIIYVDLDQLQEILENIIGNAIKYTRQGSIKVSVTDSGGKVRISVTDTGIGIPAEDVPHLFQKFYRVDNSDTREIGGSGLGLYLIKKLTELLDGQVGVDSDYGRGSTFWVEFNVLSRDQAVVKAREIKARQARAAAHRKPPEAKS
jgi:signal transduction histidine kinase